MPLLSSTLPRRCPRLCCSLLLPRPRPPRPCLAAAASSPRRVDGERSEEKDNDKTRSTDLLPDQLVATAAAGATLGPLCDSLHSSHGVLRYAHPSRIDFLDLETTWWTPLLFALAGVILGAGLPFLDEKFSSASTSSSSSSSSPSPPLDLDRGWPLTLLAIAAFVLIYFLSAVGGEAGQSPEWLLPALWLCSLSLFAAVDATPQGLLLAASTAVGGPGIEFFLIKSLHLYRYTDESFLGAFPAWIAAVYFAGGPAVGALGRRVRAELVEKEEGKRR